MIKRIRPRTRTIEPRRRQTGAALFVGLVLLLVMTVLGVSGMSTATLELAMAGNAQAQQQAFQAAETGIDIAISRGIFATSEKWEEELTVGDSDVRVCMDFEQATGVPDAAFSLGVGVPGVQAYHFEIRARAAGPRDAMSTHVQSFYVLGPGGFEDASEQCDW